MRKPIKPGEKVAFDCANFNGDVENHEGRVKSVYNSGAIEVRVPKSTHGETFFITRNQITKVWRKKERRVVWLNCESTHINHAQAYRDKASASREAGVHQSPVCFREVLE